MQFYPIDSLPLPKTIGWFDFTNGQLLVTDREFRYQVYLYDYQKTGDLYFSYSLPDILDKKDPQAYVRLGYDNQQIFCYRLPVFRKRYIPEVVIVFPEKKIIHRKKLPTYFDGFICSDSAYFFIGLYKNKWIHQYNLKMDYITSFFQVIEPVNLGAEWPIITCGYDSTIFFIHPDYPILYIVRNKQLVSAVRWKNNSWHFQIKIIGRDTVIQKLEGANSILVHGNYCYISGFSHQKKKTEFWVDIIDLRRKKYIRSEKTPSLYYFDYDGKNWFMATGKIYQKKLYKVIFQ